MPNEVVAQSGPSAPRNPAGSSPLRRRNSVRRTSSIDMTWPQGFGQRMAFKGMGRDIFTGPEGGAPQILTSDAFTAEIDQDRTVQSIRSDPPRADIGKLVGVRGGGYLRQALDEALPAEREAGSPLYLLIDDLSGTSLIANWAWSRWTEDWLPKAYAADGDEAAISSRRARMEGICTGFRPGSSALDPVRGAQQNCYPVVPLPHAEDPAGWHELVDHTDTSMRRARRVDVWLDDVIHVDATFQDSASVPTGGRVAIHEYKLSVTADPETMTLLTIEADPRILPYPECPAAAANVVRLVGTPMRELRAIVLQELRRTKGCTHLNDALRALAEVPLLVAELRCRQASAK